MKAYVKPVLEIADFIAREEIAGNSIFEYDDANTVPVRIFQIQQNGWNGSVDS